MKPYTDKELEILTILWELKEASVQEIHDALKTKSGYTTTLKLMQIMFDKKLLDRRKEGKKHIYIPILEKKEAQNYSMKNILKSLFGGSTIGFAQSFLGNSKPNPEELQKIKELIKKMEDNA